MSDLGDSIQKVLRSVVAAAASCFHCDMQCKPVLSKTFMQLKTSDSLDLSKHVISGSIKQFLDLYKVLHDESRNVSNGELANSLVESEADIVSSTELVECFASTYVLLGMLQVLNIPILLRESCLHFVNGGGMEWPACILSDDSKNSAASELMILGVVEQATQYLVGCEGYLGWWPREDDNVLNDISKGYSQLLQLSLQEQSHDVASLATYILRRLGVYEVISKYKNLINTSGAIEDPSPVARASKSLMLGHSEGLLLI